MRQLMKSKVLDCNALIQVNKGGWAQVYCPAMMHQKSEQALHVERLSRSAMLTVYPVMREAVPSLSLADWLRYARKVTAGRADAPEGVLIATRRGTRYPSGAVCYRRDHSMTLGTILTAEHFIALDLLYPQVVLRSLLVELDNVALRLNCTAIRSIVHGARADLLADLEGAGHQSEGVTLTKSIAAPVDLISSLF